VCGRHVARVVEHGQLAWHRAGVSPGDPRHRDRSMLAELIFEAAGPQSQILDAAEARRKAIYSGSNKIQRSIIAKAELGL